MKKSEAALTKALAGLEETVVLAKARVKAYTRKDGTFVKEHDNNRQAAKPDAYGGHPTVVGRIHSHKELSGRDEVDGKGDPMSATTTSIGFAGKTYSWTGKTGKSAHDGIPVRAFEHEESGHRVWVDAKGRVHADSTTEVAGLRKQHEAHAGGKAGKKTPAAAAAKPLDHDGWASKVKETHGDGVEFKKDAKNGVVHAWSGSDHVGRYRFGQGGSASTAHVAEKKAAGGGKKLHPAS